MGDETITIRLDKLVRDKLPDIMKGLGEEPEVTYLEGDKLRKALAKKIIEEYGELKKLDVRSPSYVKELVDSAEASDAYSERFGVPDDQKLVQIIEEIQLLIEEFEDQIKLRECRAERVAERGSFRDGAYVGKLVLQTGDIWIDYYRKEPERFPEISKEHT